VTLARQKVDDFRAEQEENGQIPISYCVRKLSAAIRIGRWWVPFCPIGSAISMSGMATYMFSGRSEVPRFVYHVDVPP